MGVTDPKPPSPGDMADSFLYFIQTNKERNKFGFRKSIDPAFATAERYPIQHQVARLKGWGSLTDAVFVTNAASFDTVLYTRSEVPLSDDAASPLHYTYTVPESDGNRASLPSSIGPNGGDTAPIGIALDLSSKTKVHQPIPAVEGESSHPLPALCILNTEGVLSYWWFLNNDAIQRGIPAPGLVAVEGSTNPMSPQRTAVSSPATAASPFANTSQPTFGTSAFEKTSTPAFGTSAFAKPPASTPTAAPAFGAPGFASKPTTSSTPAFGSSSAMGSSSPWSAGGAKSAFGQPSFGSTSAVGSTGAAFGSTGGLGQKPNLWGAPPTAVSKATATPFAEAAKAGSGFAQLGSTAAASPFTSLAGGTNAKPSPFASKSPFAAGTPTPSFGSTQQSFGSTVTVGSSVGGSTIGSKSVFGSFPPPSQPPSLFSRTSAPIKVEDQDMSEEQTQQGSSTPKQPSSFGSNTPFKAESIFKPGQSAKELGKEDESGSNGGLSLSGLGSTMSDVTIKPDPEQPKKSLFDIPSIMNTIEAPEGKTTEKPVVTETPASPEAKQSATVQEPEPPQVTSKPMPSPVTTASSSTHSVQSFRSSTAGHSPLVNQRESSRLSEGEQADDGDDDGSNVDGDEPEISEPHSDNEHTPAKSQVDSDSPDNTLQSIMGSSTQSPAGTSPLPPRSVLSLKQMPSSASSSPLIKGVPPPAPTPPVNNSARPLFGELNSTTPAGVPHPRVHFPPPKVQESPRSPSPVRRTTNGSIPKPVRVTTVPQPAPVTRQVAREESPSSDEDQDDQDDGASLISALSDDEDLRIQALLAQPIPATRELDPFLAHQDYVGAVTLEGLPGQVEKLYRDVNSMVDTLGLNSRNLEAFVRGHFDYPDMPRERVNLGEENEEPWTLDEIERLQNIEKELEEDLDQDAIREVMTALNSLGKLLRGTKAMKEDARKMKAFIEAKKNPDTERRARDMPLDPATQNVQRRLRAAVATYKALLADAEDKATVVRAKLASRGRGRGVPTVEAVESTIRKMTAMVEQRSGDVDVLEMQLRKLGIKPRTAPASPRRGRTFSAEAQYFDEHNDESSTNSVAPGTRVRGDAERTRQLVNLRERRRAVLKLLKEGLEKKGVQNGVA